MPTYTTFKGRKGGNPVQSSTTRPDVLVGDNVLVRITASGICGTDLHYKDLDMVLGHEGVGVVEELGPDAKVLKKGDRVGWGFETDCCEHCDECQTGHEIFCSERAMYGEMNLDQGSFGSHAIWRESFLHVIPGPISDVDAAPLQCGGATVFTPLKDANPGDVVGIMGVGGLGHLAIQFAAKMGFRVVVISGTDRKREESLKLGAHEFIATKDAKELKTSLPIDKLLVTTSAQPDWDAILPILAPRSVIYPLSVSVDHFSFPYMPLILQGITVQGSCVATRSVHRKMMAFAALHDIKPIVQEFPMTEDGIADALEKLEKGQIYYRAVLVPAKA